MANINKPVSITFSPRNLLQEDIDAFQKWMMNMDESQNSKIMTIEEGNKLHIQCGILSYQRTDNIRRTLKNVLNWTSLDEDEQKYSLKINSHNDWKYLVGYCQKQNSPLFTNIDTELLRTYKDYYIEEKNKKTTNNKSNSKNWICTSINNLIQSSHAYCIDKGINPQYTGLRALITHMCSKDLIPFSMARKIKKSDEIFWREYVNIQSGQGSNLEELTFYYDEEDNSFLRR